MFGLSGAELAIIALVIILLFGVGRITKIGSELGSGLKSFRDALKEDDEKPAELEVKKKGTLHNEDDLSPQKEALKERETEQK